MHAKALGLCGLFTDHSLFGFADLSSIMANRALLMFLSPVDNCICVSNVAKENTVLRGGMEPERVFVIPNAIDSSAFTPDPSCRDPDNSKSIRSISGMSPNSDRRSRHLRTS